MSRGKPFIPYTVSVRYGDHDNKVSSISIFEHAAIQRLDVLTPHCRDWDPHRSRFMEISFYRHNTTEVHYWSMFSELSPWMSRGEPESYNFPIKV